MKTSHNTLPTPSAEVPDELKGLTLENIEKMRRDQFYDLQVATMGKASFIDKDDYETSRDEAFAAFEEKRGEFLDAQGIDENHPQREEYMEYLRSLSIDKIPRRDWHFGPRQPDGSFAPSGRDRTREAFSTLVDQHKNGTAPTPPGARESMFDDEGVNEKLDETRKRFAELLSKRTTKMFESRKKSKEIDAAHEGFSDMVSALATEMMLDLESQGIDEDTIRIEIDKFTDEQVDFTMNDLEAERASEYTKRSPMMKRFLKTWASWGGNGKKFFSKERFKGNVKKSIMVGLPTAGVVALAAPAIGAIGAGAVVGAGIFHIARSTARRLANNKLDDTADSETIASKQAEDMRNRKELMLEGSADTGLHDLLGMVKERSASYRKRNQRRLIGSIALAASVDLLVGATIGNALTDSDIKFGKAGEWASDKANDIKSSRAVEWVGDKAKDIKDAVTGDKDTHMNTERPAGGREIDDPSRTAEKVVPKPTVTETGPDFSPDAYQIERNEGWIRQLKDIDPDITNAQLQDKLDKLLATNNPELKKWVYEYTYPDGRVEPRITRPGKMPESVLKSIVKL